MSLGPALAGSLDRPTVHSALLEDNPLGDPAALRVRGPRRERGNGAAPGGLPLAGLWRAARGVACPMSSGPTTIDRVDRMISTCESPPALLVFVDATTSWGGSQFLSSPGCGRYLDYLCDEFIPFVDARYPTLPVNRPPRRMRQVFRRLSRDGDPDAQARRVRGDDLARRRRAVRVLLQPFFPVAARSLRGHSTARGSNWRLARKGPTWIGGSSLSCLLPMAPHAHTARTQILRNCRRSMPRAGRVLIVERLIPEDGSDAVPTLVSDINMLVITGR